MEKLLFVYNADAGLFSQVTDFAHKVIAPETYACNLCKLTYGNLKIKQEWKKFLETLTVEKEFLHRNEFAVRYPDFSGAPLPAIFSVSQGKPIQLISADEINAIEGLEMLQELILKKLG